MQAQTLKATAADVGAAQRETDAGALSKQVLSYEHLVRQLVLTLGQATVGPLPRCCAAQWVPNRPTLDDIYFMADYSGWLPNGVVRPMPPLLPKQTSFQALLHPFAPPSGVADWPEAE